MLVVKFGKNCILNEQLNFNVNQNKISNISNIHNNNQNNQTDNRIKAVPKLKLSDNLSFINEKVKKLIEKKNSLNKFASKFFSNNYCLEDIKNDIEQIEKSLNENKEEISSEKKKFNDIILGIDNINEDEAQKVINANNNQEGKEIDEIILNYIKNHMQTFIDKIN